MFSFFSPVVRGSGMACFVSNAFALISFSSSKDKAYRLIRAQGNVVRRKHKKGSLRGITQCYGGLVVEVWKRDKKKGINMEIFFFVATLRCEQS